ncbi:hypothetical protein N806_29715 [Rhodococcus sp. P27]|nr:hypothetical protein N806_29715 [Rhodococcus sp. P27]
MKAAPKPKVRVCIDCESEGITSKRKAPHPGPRCASHHRVRRNTRRTATHAKHIEATYGITTDEYWAIYESQGKVCAICKRANGSRKRLSVDHDHATGEVRGLLCTPCNRNVLGHLRDDAQALQRAIGYLSSPPARRVIGTRIVPDAV